MNSFCDMNVVLGSTELSVSGSCSQYICKRRLHTSGPAVAHIHPSARLLTCGLMLFPLGLRGPYTRSMLAHNPRWRSNQ